MLWASNSDSVNQINLFWNPVYDSNFKSYEIQLDLATNGLTDQSPIINFFNDPILQDMRKNNFSIENINNTETWLFRIRAIDYFNNIGTWSTEVSNLLPGHSPPITILDFNDV